jgi:hypothetical protein
MKIWFLWALIILAELVALEIFCQNFISNFTYSGFKPPGDLGCFLINAYTPLHAERLPPWALRNTCAFMNPPPVFLLAAPLLMLQPRTPLTERNCDGAQLLTFAPSSTGEDHKAGACEVVGDQALRVKGYKRLDVPLWWFGEVPAQAEGAEMRPCRQTRVACPCNGFHACEKIGVKPRRAHVLRQTVRTKGS